MAILTPPTTEPAALHPVMADRVVTRPPVVAPSTATPASAARSFIGTPSFSKVRRSSGSTSSMLFFFFGFGAE